MIAEAWRERWEHIIPFLSLPAELRRAVYTTNTHREPQPPDPQERSRPADTSPTNRPPPSSSTSPSSEPNASGAQAYTLDRRPAQASRSTSETDSPTDHHHSRPGLTHRSSDTLAVAPRPGLSAAFDMDGRASALAVGSTVRGARERAGVRGSDRRRRRPECTQGSDRRAALAAGRRRAVVADRRKAPCFPGHRHADRVCVASRARRGLAAL